MMKLRLVILAKETQGISSLGWWTKPMMCWRQRLACDFSVGPVHLMWTIPAMAHLISACVKSQQKGVPGEMSGVCSFPGQRSTSLVCGSCWFYWLPFLFVFWGVDLWQWWWRTLERSVNIKELGGFLFFLYFFLFPWWDLAVRVGCLVGSSLLMSNCAGWVEVRSVFCRSPDWMIACDGDGNKW